MPKENRKIEVVPYDPVWPQQYALEADQIKGALGTNCIAIHHVGSTAVPGLAAKPKIDILVVVNQPEDTLEKLAAIGFDYRGEYNIPFHYGFSKRGKVNVNLHVYQNGHPEIALNLAFRNYLRIHPEIRDAYAALKKGLLEKESSFEKNNSLFTGYNLGKDAFIRRVLELAGFHRLRMVKCTHDAEWKVARRLRQRYFFDKVPISDPYEWTFNHPDHVHFVLVKGVEFIGYAHIQLWPESRAALRIVVVEEGQRNQGYGGQFLKWMESWLQWKGYKSIHMESSPDAVKFYRDLGYINMPFNDPDGHEGDPRDTPMGKVLERGLPRLTFP